MVTDEEECPVVQEIELHADESIGVARQMMQRDPLAEIHGSFIERLPVQRELQVYGSADDISLGSGSFTFM